MKRILALLLSLIMCLTLIPAAAAEDAEDIPLVEVEEEIPITIIDPESFAGEEVAAEEDDLPVGRTFQTAKEITYGTEYFNYWTADNDHLCYYIKFVVTERGKVDFYFTKPTDSEGEYGRLKFVLYMNDAENIIWESNCYQLQYSASDRYSFTEGLNPGTYYLSVLPGFTVKSGVIETYFGFTFTATDAFEVEPNGSGSEANVLRHGVTYGAYHDGCSESDFFRFAAEAGKDYKIYIGNFARLDKETIIIRLIAPDSSEKSIMYYMSFDDMGDYYLLSSAQAGNYTVKVYNYVGAPIPYTIGIFEPGVNYDPPAITTQPKSVKADKDATVTFTVKASGEGLKYQWEYRTSSTGTWKTTTLTGAKTKTLSVKATESRNGYQYRCVVTNKNGEATSKAATLTINGMEKPVITTQPADKTAASGATVKFTVKTTGATGYQWYYRKTSSGSWTKCTDGTSATLSVEAKNYRDGFQYRCKVMNGSVYEYTNVATLHVKPGITTQPADKTAASGATVTFTVKAEGATSYQWYYRKTSTGSWTKCTNGTSATLSVEAKNYRDGFQYRCKVSNSAGYVYTNAATLRVKPGITTQPTDKTASAGTTVTFTVKAEGATSYQWYYRKTSSGSWTKCTDGTSATLTVEAKNYRNGFQYRCKVMNDVGYIYTSVVTLTVK